MTIRRDGCYVRKNRLIAIARQIVFRINNSTANSVQKQTILNWAVMQFGLTEKRLEEYIDVVVKAKGWSLSDGIITIGELDS